jgi:hypothetical protein
MFCKYNIYVVKRLQLYNCLSPINVCTSVFLKGRSIVVRQVTKLRAGQSVVRIPAGARDFSLLKT